MFHSSKDRTDILALLLLMPSSWANSSTWRGLLAISSSECTMPMVLLTPQWVAMLPIVLYLNCDLASENVFESMNTNNTKAGKSLNNFIFFLSVDWHKQYQQKPEMWKLRGYIILSISSIRQKFGTFTTENTMQSLKNHTDNTFWSMKILPKDSLIYWSPASQLQFGGNRPGRAC